MNTATPTIAPLSIAYFPSDDSSNAYTQSMRDILATLGSLQRFEFRSRLLGLLKGDFRRVDAIVVNWIDNDLINNRSGRLSLWGMSKLMLKTLVIRTCARRRIFVRHNLYPHAASVRSASLLRRLVAA